MHMSILFKEKQTYIAMQERILYIGLPVILQRITNPLMKTMDIREYNTFPSIL